MQRIIDNEKEYRRKEYNMNLSVNTALGEFTFKLSQASVIYLLGVAQQLEDEGDVKIPECIKPKIAVDAAALEHADKKDLGERIAGLINELGISQRELADRIGVTEVSMSRYIRGDRTPKGPIIADMATALNTTTDYLLGVEKKDDEEKQKELLSLTDDQEEFEPQDFGDALEEFEQKQKRAWNETSGGTYGSGDGKYKGFLFIRCEHCGETRGFNAKVPIDEYKCSECGGKTKLIGLRPAHLDCDCGKHWKYQTNETADVLTINCINCGQPVDMMLNARRTAYTSIGGGATRKGNGWHSRITTAKYRW